MSDRDDDWVGDDAIPADDAESTNDADPTDDAVATGVGDPDRDADASAVAAGRASGLEAGKLTTYLLWGAIAGLAVLAVVAAAGLYTSLSSLIDVWIGDPYRPLASAVLNFAVLCAAAAGIAVLLRRL